MRYNWVATDVIALPKVGFGAFMGRRKQKAEWRRKYPPVKLLTYLSVAVVILGIGLYLIFEYAINDAPPDCSQVDTPRAAIVDQLSTSSANETFVQESTALLNQAGFAVDYYPGEAVTVDFYRNLPTHCYRLILLRVHSASFNPEQSVFDLFTSEPYSRSKYVAEQVDDRLRRCAFDTVDDPYVPGDPEYFGITHKFVSGSMLGQFYRTVVVMMGCEGMKYENMADAFIQKGALVYIGWDKLVTASHTDEATVELLRLFVTEKKALTQAIAETMSEVESDPIYQAVLDYYPLASGNCTMDDVLKD